MPAPTSNPPLKGGAPPDGSNADRTLCLSAQSPLGAVVRARHTSTDIRPSQRPMDCSIAVLSIALTLVPITARTPTTRRIPRWAGDRTPGYTPRSEGATPLAKHESHRTTNDLDLSDDLDLSRSPVPPACSKNQARLLLLTSISLLET